jgi:hypothetical protein
VIRHSVLFKLKPETTKFTVDDLLALVRALPDQIDVIHEISAGANVGVPDNWHIAVCADFDSIDDFDHYRDHPAHIDFFVNHMTPHLETRAAVQYELDKAKIADACP